VVGSIRFLGCDQDAYCESVARHVGEFEELTGHHVDVQLIDNDEYFSNKLQPYLDGESPADVFVSGPVLLWEHVGNGFVEPLDPYLEKASDDYDVDDFSATLTRVNRWTGRFGDPLGTGPLLEIPVNCESYNLAYNPAVLERAGVEVPATWDEYFSASRLIAERDAPRRGFAQRGADEWHTIYTGYASQLWSYGARDFDEQGRCVIDSPAALRATKDIVGALRECGPSDWLHQRWYELAIDVAQGKYGLIVDSDHYVAFYENPALSSVHGHMGYELPPTGPGGLRHSNLWSWSAVMNAHSRDKDTAWAFLEWATGKKFLLRSAFEGNMNPTRRSVWQDQSFIDFSSQWGPFSSVAQTLINDVADVLVTPCVNYIDVARRWTTALRDGFRNPDDIDELFGAAARDIDRIVAR
jgi:multiple sugar transport system substrate-binding protein